MKLMFCRELQRLVPKDIIEAPIEDRKAWAEEHDKNKGPFVPCAPRVVSDDLGLNGIRNHADGRMYDSKSAYYSAVKAAGCEVVGNEKMTHTPVDKTGNVEKDLYRAAAEHGY